MAPLFYYESENSWVLCFDQETRGYSLAYMLTTDGQVAEDTAEINACLGTVDVFLARWPLPESPDVLPLLDKPALEESEKEVLLKGFDDTFLQLQKTMKMKSRDLIVLHPDTPGLSSMLDRFSPCHTHDDEEVRYVIDGEGEFGFVLQSGEQVLLRVEAGDFIYIPKETEHWFVLTKKQRIKAIRYFSDTSGWVPRYTSSKVKIS